MARKLLGVVVLVLLLSGGCAHKPKPVSESAQPRPKPAPAATKHVTSALPKPNGANLDGNVNVALGVPLDPDPGDDYLIDRTYWVSSYNPKRLEPNWVAWRLVADDLGSAERTDAFSADNSLPAGFGKVPNTGYEHSGA